MRTVTGTLRETGDKGGGAERAMAAKVDAFLEHCDNFGYQHAKRVFRRRAEPTDPSLSADKGVAAFARAAGRTEAEVRTAYERLRVLAAETAKAGKESFCCGPPSKDELLALSSIDASAEQIWALVDHTARQIKARGQTDLGRAPLHLVCLALEHALSKVPVQHVPHYFGPRMFDAQGRLLPDRTDRLWITARIADSRLDTFVAKAKKVGLEVDRPVDSDHWEAGIVLLGVPLDVDRARISTVLAGAGASLDAETRYWLAPRKAAS